MNAEMLRNWIRAAGSIYDLLSSHIQDAYAAHAFGAAARCPLSLRPLPWEEWARGGASVAIQALFPQPAGTTATSTG
ncbi:hypothetical protein ACF1BU_34655 [Streptomyces sp. NPDC014724]|uniref:hypothetical protein n=1 Tax=unclassified Streptomyces TaxID=2593676 RepID=UPI00370236D8